MNKILSILVLILVFGNVKSQECDRADFDLILNEQEFIVFPIRITENGILSWSIIDGVVSFGYANSDLEINDEIELELIIDDVKHEMYDVIETTDELYVLSTSDDQKKIYATRFNINTMEFDETELIYEDKIGAEEVEVTVSENKEFILVQYNLVDSKKKAIRF